MSSNDSQIMNYLVRMVVPMRREFDEVLNVQNFLHDQVYAQDVLKKALSSQDSGLRERAEYISKLKFGPRVGEASPAAGKPPSTPASANAPAGFVERRKTPRDTPGQKAPSQKATSSAASKAVPDKPLSAEEEMRQSIMKKYTSGLR